MKFSRPYNFHLLFLLFFTFFNQNLAANDNGFGETVNWIEYDAAIADTSRPTLVILHKSWCGACKSLKPKIAQSSDFEQLSAKFSMVNANEENSIHNLEHFNIDGSYIPRVFFLDPDGQVLSEMTNANGNPNYKYYHYQVSTILESMKKVLQDFPVKDEL